MNNTYVLCIHIYVHKWKLSKNYKLSLLLCNTTNRIHNSKMVYSLIGITLSTSKHYYRKKYSLDHLIISHLLEFMPVFTDNTFKSYSKIILNNYSYPTIQI